MTKQYKYNETRDEGWSSHETGRSARKFRRNKIDGGLGGVCSGIGDYLCVDAIIIRIAFVIAFFMTGGVAFWIYVALWVFVPKDNRAPYRREARDTREARSAASTSPESNRSFKDVKSKYRSLEQRLANLERSITSSEWQLRREFRDLES